MTEERLKLGAWGEDQAAAWLRRQGAKILERNLRTPVGEIDIVARLKKQILFVEVKTRSSLAFGTPAEAVGVRKQRQIIRTAQWYLQQKAVPNMHPRFDVISVLRQDDDIVIEHYPNAFELPA